MEKASPGLSQIFEPIRADLEKVDAEFAANKAAFLGSGIDSLNTLIDIIGREKIDCGLITNGRFTGAWTPKHYDDQASKVEMFNKYADVGAEMIPRERVREMMASDYYYGGMYVKRGGHLHPARYYKGLLEAAHGLGAILCGNVEAERMEKTGTGWRVLTAKGPIACREVVIATNGYTGDLTPKLKMRVVPVASHIIATEELPIPATDLIPLQRSIGDTSSHGRDTYGCNSSRRTSPLVMTSSSSVW